MVELKAADVHQIATEVLARTSKETESVLENEREPLSRGTEIGTETEPQTAATGTETETETDTETGENFETRLQDLSEIRQVVI